MDLYSSPVTRWWTFSPAPISLLIVRAVGRLPGGIRPGKIKWDHRLANASSGVSITVGLYVGLKVHLYLQEGPLTLSSNTVLASQHQPLSTSALGVCRQELSGAGNHGLAGSDIAMLQYLVSSKPFKMNKTTLNFALFWSGIFLKVNSSLRENNSGHKNEAEHPTSIFA